MQNDSVEPSYVGHGFDGTVRMLIIFALLALAGIGLLVVFDVVDFGTFSTLAVKLAAISGIVAATAAAIWAVTFRRT